jgi:hypothetical protein
MHHASLKVKASKKKEAKKLILDSLAILVKMV